jgi:hypothetical protein
LPFFKPARQAPAASCPAWQTFRAVKEPRLADAIADNHSLQAQSLVWQIAKDARFASMDESGKRAMQNDPESFLDELRSDPARFSDEYKRRFGNILNADDAATLFDRYNASPLTMRTVVHPAATELRDSLLQERLAEDAPQERTSYCSPLAGMPLERARSHCYPERRAPRMPCSTRLSVIPMKRESL